MKRKKVIFSVIGILLLCGIVGGTWGWKAYHRTRQPVDLSASAIDVSSTQLYHDFNTDEEKANQKYTNQVVAVSGKVADIQSSNGAVAILLDAGTDAAGAVNCTMANPAAPIQKGDQVTVKGRCLGFLMDVNIVDAAIIPSQNHK